MRIIVFDIYLAPDRFDIKEKTNDYEKENMGTKAGFGLKSIEWLREPVMKGWLLIILAASMNLAGCAAGFSYQFGPPTPYVPHITDVPPSFYDNDPALRHWYTYPYWNPNMDVFP